MACSNKEAVGSWISFVLRVAMASLFFSAAMGKFRGGLQNVVIYFQQMFQETWLPSQMILLHAKATPFIEAVIPIWLLIGFKLRIGWVVTALFTVSLAFGMAVVKKYDVAADNYFYVLLCCVGLYFSQFDRLSADGMLKAE